MAGPRPARTSGAASGATKVSLPNIVRKFFGFVTPFIIQNVGTAGTTATASFISFDGTKTASITRQIEPGRSKFIDPNSEIDLSDQTQYAVTVTASQPISVIVNTHKDAPGDPAPVMYSANGIVGGADTLYGPYAVKNIAGVGKGISTIVVQNTGTASATPSLVFTPLQGSGTTTFAGPALAAGAAWAFDPALHERQHDPRAVRCGGHRPAALGTASTRSSRAVDRAAASPPS